MLDMKKKIIDIINTDLKGQSLGIILKPLFWFILSM